MRITYRREQTVTVEVAEPVSEQQLRIWATADFGAGTGLDTALAQGKAQIESTPWEPVLSQPLRKD